MPCLSFETETSQIRIKTLVDVRLLLRTVVIFSRDSLGQWDAPVDFLMSVRPHESAGFPSVRFL